MTLFEQLGGEPKLRAIIDDFVERTTSDILIGFMFRNVNKARLKELEYQHAAEHLGAGVRYRGKPLDSAHKPHRIMGGQFARRRELLRKTLVEHDAPQAVIDSLLAHTDSLRELVTADPHGECIG